ncbi:phosphatidylinositol/phosphatidylcholine transfer protein SFH2-like protein [Carex littledalei]|uniref:Phosphatidylinositol/phosphatidylcholine transfer protein SFH2-like protein n=1 Tax=Carex littledalei TaxID=544730 RepID=A0A833R1D5_9POAL|nr:phosphatidylinositol/phosphatidylcholine transfer protein SFH2-like protein [Carex littledalei]
MGPTARCNITVFQFLLKLLRFSSLRSISLLSSQKLPNFSISTSVFAISSLFAEISEIAQLSCTPCDIALPLRLSLSWIRYCSLLLILSLFLSCHSICGFVDFATDLTDLRFRVGQQQSFNFWLSLAVCMSVFGFKEVKYKNFDTKKQHLSMSNQYSRVYYSLSQWKTTEFHLWIFSSFEIDSSWIASTREFQKPIVPVDLYRSVRDLQLVGMSGYSKESLLERKGLHAINRNNDNNDDMMMMVLQYLDFKITLAFMFYIAFGSFGLALLIPISKRMASDMKKRMLDLNRWPTRNSKGTQFQLAMTYVDTNLGRGWYKSRHIILYFNCAFTGTSIPDYFVANLISPGMEPWRRNDLMAGRAATSNSHLKDEFVDQNREFKKMKNMLLAISLVALQYRVWVSDYECLSLTQQINDMSKGIRGLMVDVYTCRQGGIC